MKRLIYLLLLLPFAVSAQTTGIKIATPIIKNNPVDNTITGYADLQNGGYHIVGTKAGLDSLLTQYSSTKKNGMIGYVTGIDSTFRLVLGAWVNIGPGNPTYTFSSGLTKIGSTVKLGGDLTSGADLGITGSNYLEVYEANNYKTDFFIGNSTMSLYTGDDNNSNLGRHLSMKNRGTGSDGGAGLYTQTGNGYRGIFFDAFDAYFGSGSQPLPTNQLTIVDNITNKGIVYHENYGINFTARSLIDKGYADSLVRIKVQGLRDSVVYTLGNITQTITGAKSLTGALTTTNVIYTNGGAFGAYASSPTGNPSSYLTNLGLKVGNTDNLTIDYYGITKNGFVKDIGGSVYIAAMQSSSGTLAYLADIPSVSGYVPYTGATANLVTTFNVSAKTLISTGTAGNGYLDLLSQSVSPSSTSGHLKIYSDSLNRLSWKNSTYRRTIQVPYSSDVTIRMPYKATPTLADSTDIAAGYIQNQTALTQTGGFKINGNGTLANITASGTSTFGVGYNGTNANKVTITENNTSSAIGVVGIQNKSNVGYSSFDMYDDSGVFKFGIGYANSGAGGTLASNSYLYSATGSFIFTGSGGEIFRYTSTGLSTAYQYAVSKTALATTSADGILLANTTAATSGVPIQYSPDFRLRGTSWNTTATAASNTQDAKIELRPTSGTTTGSLFALAFSNNGGAYIDGFTVASSGNVYTPGNINTGSRIGLNMISGASALLHFGTAFSFSTSGSFAALNGTGIRQDALTYTSTSASGTITAASVNSFAISSLAAGTAGTTISDAYTWYIAGAPTASTNVSSITRSWAFGVNSGSSYFGGAVVANSTITLKGYTVATLPAGTVGMTAYVTDALAPTYLVAVAGGGSVKTPVFFDGTNWVAH